MHYWKNELKEFYKGPPPMKKQAFLRRLPQSGMSAYEFLLSQIGYIRKGLWALSILIFAAAVTGAVLLPFDVLWLISALTPMIALGLVSESGRSEFYEMAELEMSTRFSLRSVVLARLAILGTANLLVLCLMIPVALWNHMRNPIVVGLYIVTPYLLTAFIGLYIVRTVRGHEAVYACAAIAAAISCIVLFSHKMIGFIYARDFVQWWVAAALALCIGTGKQYVAMIHQTEELTWN